MNKPDLHELARRAETLHDAIREFGTALEDAYGDALGDYDEETEETVAGTASGDDAGYFERAKAITGEAAGGIATVQEILATVQGWREFSESGAVPTP